MVAMFLKMFKYRTVSLNIIEYNLFYVLLFLMSVYVFGLPTLALDQISLFLRDSLYPGCYNSSYDDSYYCQADRTLCYFT